MIFCYWPFWVSWVKGRKGTKRNWCICERGVFPHLLSVGCGDRCLYVNTLCVLTISEVQSVWGSVILTLLYPKRSHRSRTRPSPCSSSSHQCTSSRSRVPVDTSWSSSLNVLRHRATSNSARASAKYWNNANSPTVCTPMFGSGTSLHNDIIKC